MLTHTPQLFGAKQLLLLCGPPLNAPLQASIGGPSGAHQCMAMHLLASKITMAAKRVSTFCCLQRLMMPSAQASHVLRSVSPVTSSKVA